jgi:hypothetical protein
MEEKTKKLMRACLALSSTERKELAKALTDYESKGLLEQINFGDVLNKSLGPMDSNRCAVCGK